MTWVRCRRCRTVGDREAATSCLGCGTPFHEAPAETAPPPAPPVQRQAKRDLSVANIFTLLLGVFAAAGLVYIAKDPPGGDAAGAAIIDFFVIALFFIVLLGRGIHKAKFGCFISGLLVLAGVAAAFFGAFLLVAAACSGSW